MKRIVLLLLICFTSIGCSNSSIFSIDATTDHSDNKKVYLIKVGEDNRPSAIDSTEVIEGKFSFTDSIVVPEMHYVYFENERENIPVVLEPGSIKIKIYKDSVRSSKITGTKSNVDFNKYLKETNDFYIELNKIQAEIRNASIIKDSLDLDLSAAVKPDISEAKYRWYQDWVSWLDEDILDFCVIMNYYTDFNKFNSINNIISRDVKNKDKINIGISVFNQPQSSVSNKIMYSRLDGYNNFTLFPYNLTKDTLNWYEPIYETLDFYIE